MEFLFVPMRVLLVRALSLTVTAFLGLVMVTRFILAMMLVMVSMVVSLIFRFEVGHLVVRRIDALSLELLIHRLVPGDHT